MRKAEKAKIENRKWQKARGSRAFFIFDGIARRILEIYPRMAELLAPRAEAGEPAGHVAAVLFVAGTEDFAEMRLFVEAHKEGHEEDGDAGDDKRGRVRTAEDDPEAYPAGEEADVHRIADIAIEADYNEALRRSNRRGRAASSPAEIPDASERRGEAEDGGNGGEPAPTGGLEGGSAKAEPVRKKPEPEGKETGADGKRSAGSEPSRERCGIWGRVCVVRHGKRLCASMRHNRKLENGK